MSAKISGIDCTDFCALPADPGRSTPDPDVAVGHKAELAQLLVEVASQRPDQGDAPGLARSGVRSSSS